MAAASDFRMAVPETRYARQGDELPAESWRPNRTAACRVLWWSLDNEPG